MDQLDCPACNRSLQFPAGGLAAQQVKCPACGAVFEPQSTPEAATPSPSAPEVPSPRNSLLGVPPDRRPRARPTRWLILAGVVAVVSALIVACLTRREAGSKGSATSHFNRGTDLLGKGDYDRAVAELDEAIRLDPTFAFPLQPGRGLHQNGGIRQGHRRP